MNNQSTSDPIDDATLDSILSKNGITPKVTATGANDWYATVKSARTGATDTPSGEDTPGVGGITPNDSQTVRDTVKTFAKGVADKYTDAGKSITEDESDPNKLRGGFNMAGDFSGAVLAPITQGIGQAISSIANHVGDSETAQKFAGSTPVSAALDFIKNSGDKLSQWSASHPEISHAISSLANIAGMVAEPAAESVAKGAISTGADTLSDAAKSVIDKTKEVVSPAIDTAKSAVSDSASAIKNKIAPVEDINTTVGKVAQGKTKDIPSFKRGLTSPVTDNEGNVISPALDTSKVKTYKDLANTAKAKIKSVTDIQDAHISSQDPTPHSLTDFDKTVGEGDNAVKINYVKEGMDNLRELYANTSDAEGLAKMKSLESKANEEGLTTQEVNSLAREYGSEFGNKAFGKVNKEPLTSVNAQKFENIRSGLKDTARDMLPDATSKGLDRQMTDLYKVHELSSKMAEKVNTVLQRLQSKNFLQKVGAKVGQIGKISGVGDIVKEMTGLGNTPGASTMNAVDIEAKLSKNLSRINQALGQDDSGFINSIKDIIHHPK